MHTLHTLHTVHTVHTVMHTMHTVHTMRTMQIANYALHTDGGKAVYATTAGMHKQLSRPSQRRDVSNQNDCQPTTRLVLGCCETSEENNLSLRTNQN